MFAYRPSPAMSGYLLALSATILWSTVYIFAKTLADAFSPAELTFWRWLVAFFAVLPFTWKGLWTHRAIIRRHLVRLMAFSFVGMAFFSLTIFLAGSSTSATNMSLIAATAPIFIALICRFALGQRLHGLQIAGLVIAAAGTLVLVSKGQCDTLRNLALTRGDLWMLTGAMCFGLYSILVSYRPAALPQAVFLAVMTGLSMLWMLPLVVWEWSQQPPFVPNLMQTLGVIHIGTGASVIAFICWNLAIARIGAVRTGIVYYSLPFFSSALALVVLDERLSLPQVLGGVLIVGGIVLSSLRAILQARRLKKLSRPHPENRETRPDH